MDIQAVLDQFNEQAKGMDPIGGKVKFAIDENVVIIDGSGSENTLSFEDGDADCTISTSLETLMKMKSLLQLYASDSQELISTYLYERYEIINIFC